VSPEDQAERREIIAARLDEAAKRQAAVTAKLLKLALDQMYPTDERDERTYDQEEGQ
jgi:hypothetical protein